MKKVVVHQYGGPEELKIEEHPIPHPQKGELLVHNQYISVDYTDIYWRTGQLDAPSVPLTPGKAGAGLVAELGEDATNFKIGDRIAYIQAPGAYSEYFAAPAKLVVKLPEQVSFKEAAAMMMKGLIAEAFVKRVYPVGRNKTVFIHAMAGGVGSFLTAWSKYLGAQVIGTVGTPEKEQVASKLGADLVINRHQQNLVTEVNKFTNKQGVDVVYDGIGKATVQDSVKVLKALGLYVNFGQVSGPVDNFALGNLAEKTQYVTFANVNTFVEDLGLMQEMSHDLFDFYIETGFSKQQVITEYSFDDVAAAQELLESGKSIGSIVLKV